MSEKCALRNSRTGAVWEQVADVAARFLDPVLLAFQVTESSELPLALGDKLVTTVWKAPGCGNDSYTLMSKQEGAVTTPGWRF